jgi:hypothetical protein
MGIVGSVLIFRKKYDDSTADAEGGRVIYAEWAPTSKGFCCAPDCWNA